MVCSFGVLCLALGLGADAAGDRPRLQDDPRLRVLVTLDFQRPRLADVLRSLGEAAELRLTAPPDALAAEPAVAGLSLRRVPVWSVMEELARAIYEDGRWEKTDDGYTLTGTRLVPHPRPKDDSPPASSWRWLWLAVLVLLVGINGWFGVRYFRQRRSAAPSRSPDV